MLGIRFLNRQKMYAGNALLSLRWISAFLQLSVPQLALELQSQPVQDYVQQ